MKTAVLATLLVTSFAFAAPAAYAKGCLKGAAVGGVAGHVAHHHSFLGAAAGCAIGHHRAKQKDQEELAHRQATHSTHASR